MQLIKGCILFILSTLTTVTFAVTTPFIASPAMLTCQHAPPTTDPNYCDAFRAIAYCHCHDERHMPPAVCTDIPRLEQVLTDMYGSLWNACSAQKEVSQQECYDAWTFYNGHCLA